MYQQNISESSLKLLATNEVAQVAGGFVGDGNLTDFPPWLWPYIRPAQIQQIAAKFAAVAVH